MTIEEQLKKRAITKYKTMTAFSEAIGLHPSTVATIFKSGIMGASVRNVIKICRCLGVSVDGLEDGKLIPYVKPNDTLSDEEQEIITKYRALDPRGKKTVKLVLNSEYETAMVSSLEDSSTGAGTG